MSDVIITADKTPWYQWDTGLTVTVSGGEMTECHFANRKQGTAYVQAVINGKAKVPDELLQVAAPIKAYGYISDGGGGQTYIEQTFEVIARNIPADYTYTKTAQKTIRDAEAARDQAYAAANEILKVGNEVVGFKNEAKASAEAAKKSADHAEYQAGRAKTNADDAGVAMANAQSFAKMSSVHATESEGSAKKSAQSASAAATSASEASKSASEAATSASEAKAAAGNAASEVLAATKVNADAAAQSATDAANAKAGAETAANKAATSASAAADSAAAAAKSAGDAAASVNAINVIAPKSVMVSAIQTGTGVAIGNAAVSNFDGAVALGSGSVTDNKYQVSLGNDTLNREIIHVSEPTASTSAATKAYVDKSTNVIAPKTVATAAAATVSNLAVGNHAEAITGFGNVAIGNNATAYNESVSIGDGGTAASNNTRDAVAIGHNSSAKFTNSVALGAMSSCNKANEVSIGSPATETVAEYKREITHVSTPTNDASASTKKYTDDNDAKTLTEAKKYTDDNTTNALIGKVSGKLLHVEDAWPSPLMSVSIDGAYKQDGIPSPENPVPITVIENPVIKVTGRNILNWDAGVNKNFIKNKNGTYTLTKNTDSNRFSGEIPFDIQNEQSSYLSGSRNEFTGKVSVLVKFNDGSQITIPYSNRNFTNIIDTKDPLYFIFYIEGVIENGASFTFYPQLEYGTNENAYAPYTSVALPITLPDEHPYLAALPDGTHDEIVIDKDGNASLIARVYILQISANKTSFGAATDESAPYLSILLNTAAVSNDKNSIISNYYKSNIYTTKSGYVYLPKVNVVVYRDDRFTSREQALELLTNVITYIAQPATTYPLGKLTIPSLLDTISNVWTDAELTTNMSMTYKQDVNAVVAGLKRQIAALTDKTANDEASTNEPTIESDPDYSTGEPTTE